MVFIHLAGWFWYSVRMIIVSKIQRNSNVYQEQYYEYNQEIEHQVPTQPNNTLPPPSNVEIVTNTEEGITANV